MGSVRGRSSDAAFPSIGGPPPPLLVPNSSTATSNAPGATGRLGPSGTGAPYEVIPTIRVTGKGKMMAVKVQMLDDGVAIFQVQAKALGRVLFEQVCRQLSLLEADYFGLEYTDGHGTFYWVDLSKPMKDQMVLNTLRDPILRFCIKFYPPDPAQLEEEYTRYLFCLQVKRDMAQGHMACNENTAALLASYLVQAECGDYAAEDYPDPSYLSSYKFVPQQDAELERMIMENHKKHIGQTPAEADLNFLETARRCELYGTKMTLAKDHDGTPLNLAVAHMGIMVFQKFIRINTFSWAKVRKLSFKRKKFLVKLHPEGYVNIGGVYYKDQVEFFFDGRDECKNFWKKCVEYHGFFRCSSVKRIPRHRPKVMSRGSSFRYVGRTQKEMMDFVRGNFVKRQSFQRSQSFRHPLHSVLGSHPNLGQPMSERNASQPAHPLLPIGDVLIGAQSMGSISLSRGGTLSRKERGGTGDNSVASAAAMLGSRGAHSPVSPAHTDPGGELPDFEERRSVRGDGRMAMSRGGQDDDDDDDHNNVGKRHHYEMPETPSVATSKQTTSATSSPQRMPTTTDEDEFSSSPRRVWNQQRPHNNQQHHHRPVAPDERLTRDASLDHGDYDLNENGDEANNNANGHQSPSAAISPEQQIEDESPAPPPPPPPLTDEEGNDLSLSGLVDRVISPLTALAQETRNSIIGGTSIHSYQEAGYPRNGGVNGLDTNENEVTARGGGGGGGPDVQQEVRRKRHVGDRAYFIAKEILMTERTYKKDLEVIEIWLRDELCNSGEEGPNSEEDGMPRLILEQLFGLHDPIYDFHSALLQELEDRVGSWEQKSHGHHQRLPGSGARIGEVFHNSMPKMTPLYLDYLKEHRDMMEGLEYALRDSQKFDQLIREFENQKVCYLPLFNFILKPLHRLTHYQALLRRLVSQYAIDHPDLTSCKAALTLMSDLVARVGEVLPASDNYAKLVELQRELSGFDALVQPERLFIREGCLQKLSRKGYQQRMFFLFSDMLVYAARVTQPQLQFKVHGIMPIRNIVVEESDGRTTVPHSFTIFGGNRALLVAAGSVEEKRNWLTDFEKVIVAARERPETAIQYLSLKSASSAEDLGSVPKEVEKNPDGTPVTKPASQVNQRSNTSVHVCWHRNTSVSSLDLRLAANNESYRINWKYRGHYLISQSQLSGYLLRKFKNSSGWQKLWVVFTNFCLFFYKTYQDDFPLASLPLLSYRVTTPTPQDDIWKDFVFKLQFKNHVYFFRAESEYTFNRWMEVIGNATNRTFDFGADIARSPSLR